MTRHAVDHEARSYLNVFDLVYSWKSVNNLSETDSSRLPTLRGQKLPIGQISDQRVYDYIDRPSTCFGFRDLGSRPCSVLRLIAAIPIHPAWLRKRNSVSHRSCRIDVRSMFVESILREVVSTFQELELRARCERQNGAEGLAARAITRHAPINIDVEIRNGAALAPTFVVIVPFVVSPRLWLPTCQ